MHKWNLWSMIVNGILLFVIKKFLSKTNLLGSKELVTDLKVQLKDQQEFIDYQSKKIIELQNMILKGKQ